MAAGFTFFSIKETLGRVYTQNYVIYIFIEFFVETERHQTNPKDASGIILSDEASSLFTSLFFRFVQRCPVRGMVGILA